MPSPFPGMDPYLEDPELWVGNHNTLATYIFESLNAVLPDPYFARIEKRQESFAVYDDFEEEPPPTRKTIIDVSVLRGDGEVAVLEPRTESAEPLVTEFQREPVELASVVVLDADRENRVVTDIELLSPSNKQPGDDRDMFLAKKHRVLASEVHWVEIDLLRAGRRAIEPKTAESRAYATDALTPYVVAVYPAWMWSGSVRSLVYPVRFNEALPVFEVPLRQGLGVNLDLQYCVDRLYAAGKFDRHGIDYSKPPRPPLSGPLQEIADAFITSWQKRVKQGVTRPS